MSAATDSVSGWLSEFGAASDRGDVDAAASLFAEESYSRDLVSFRAPSDALSEGGHGRARGTSHGQLLVA
jgi:hypothetical protein